jgi:pimeloyl-ACP methyl ester carboxylesterase
MRHSQFIFVFLLAAFVGRQSCAQSAATLNVEWKTLGGQQLWSDKLVCGKWRIQQNGLTNHYRLLDPSDVRRAWGTEEQCRTAFETLKRTESISPLDGRAVIMLHGLGRSRDHMAALGAHLEGDGKFTWINMGYASTRGSLDDHAQSLASVIDGLQGIDEIHFVCHSLGNLVVRRYLGEAVQPNPRWKIDARLKRMVMLGPPNNGAQLAQVAANLLDDHDLARLIMGASAWQLAREWGQTQKLLATPTFEFGIISGGLGDGQGLNPLLDGDDDLVVRVEETRLAGAADFRIVNARHSQMVHDPLVQQYMLTFLEHGYFTSAVERQPITAQEPVPAPAAR